MKGENEIQNYDGIKLQMASFVLDEFSSCKNPQMFAKY